MFDLDFSIRLTDRRGGGFTLQSRLTTSASRLVLFGPSGSGKTLTLRAIAGLTQPSRGHIRINGQTLYDSGRGVNLPTRKRKVSLIFQDYALFPHMSVRQNIAFGARRLLHPRSKAIKDRVEQLIGTCGLSEVADSVPEEISGGQRQRAALARGLAAEPELVLMDEPFSALDKPLRVKMQRDVFTMLNRFKLPLVLVTHDQEEMERFAEAVAVYDKGTITALEASNGGSIDTGRIQQAMEQAYQS